MNNIKSSAFTLVELIVVIVILAILATIAFLSFSSQSASARDSTRLSDMSNISKGLSVFNATSGIFPMPENNISVLASGAVIGYQGYAGSSVLNMIKISNGGKDPLDTSTYYTYSVNSNSSKFQILGFLEDGNSTALSYLPFKGNEASADPSSYSGRYAITKGDSLGILLSSGSMVPVQTQFIAGSFTGVDIIKSTIPYVAQFSAKSSISGTGNILSAVTSMGSKTCSELLSKDPSRKGKDGIYYLNPTGTLSIQTFCDMTTAGGGWTLATINGKDPRTSITLGSGRVMPGGVAYGDINLVSASIFSIKAGLNDATIKNFSINAKAIFELSNREVLAYVGGPTKDYIRGTLPAACNEFDINTTCPENNGPFTMYKSNGSILTNTAYACNSSPTDTYNEFGLHILDGIDTISTNHCHAVGGSLLGFQDMGRIYATFNGYPDLFWGVGVHSYWDDNGTFNQAGYIMLR